MIYNKVNVFNIESLHRQFKDFDDTPSLPEVIEFIKLYQLYTSAANELFTKLENLDLEFQVMHDYNPIHAIDSRMKTPQSLFNKLIRKNIKISAKNVRDEIYDVAGLRVVTNYIDDIYAIRNLLVRENDIELIKEKDYIKNPKKSGYRSLHLVLSIPVFQSSGLKHVPVEIQIRTIGMDMWASLEHKLRYKNEDARIKKHTQKLEAYAQQLLEIEQGMQEIHQDL